MGKDGCFSQHRQALNRFEPIHLNRDVADTVRPRVPSGGCTLIGVPLPWLGDGQKATLPPTSPLSPFHSLFSSLALTAPPFLTRSHPKLCHPSLYGLNQAAASIVPR
jgi:hypothetical protein